MTIVATSGKPPEAQITDPHALKLPRETRKLILTNFRTPSDIHGYFHALWPAGMTLGLFWIASFLHPLNALWLVPCIGWAYNRIYFPLHDCCHYTLVKNKSANSVVGYILAALLVTPFKSFQKEHIYHHIHYGTAEDPGGVDYYVRFNNRREMALFLLSPLWGGTLLTKLKDYYRQLPGLSRSAEKAAPSSAREMPDYPGYAVIIAVQSVVLGLVTGLDISQWWRYPLFVLVPGATVFLFFSRLRMFLEHASLDYKKHDYFSHPRKTARDFFCNMLELSILSGASFKYHNEHHVFPSIPACHLKTVHTDYTRPYIEDEDLRPSYTAAIFELWGNLTPGPTTQK